MAEIINLRMARKARRRQDEAASADANRARHGQTKPAKAAAAMEAERLARQVEGAFRETAVEPAPAHPHVREQEP